MIYYVIALFIIIIDQITKILVVRNMELGESVRVVDGLFYITSHRNTGAAWGMLEGQMWLFYIVTLVVIAGILYYFHRHAKGNALFSLSLMTILGGAVGNFIDRVLRQEVVDFIQFTFFNFIFNIADAALTVGVILLLVQMILEEVQEKRKKNGKHSSLNTGK
ncbi:signal peptidase II [Jeotgalibacillus proteolyticus]|uniref:Lipoprotein signal peptidase n=1 Tax=Jeotgalibacillus proteolyticus TaxID=2082395 RepID=A0A2S5GGM9_9BACL|nr:signal peptidase II [Jeotgalibacillus proteolyticus]PPA72118.1 signal peptidase II [Jeotgalibacillus proteolyticus]